jgi:hypothetical protein
MSELTNNSVKTAFGQFVHVHGFDTGNVTLSFDFISNALEAAINGDLAAFAAHLRLAGQFATDEWFAQGAPSSSRKS